MAPGVPYIPEKPVIAYGSGYRGISYVTDPGSRVIAGGKKRKGEGPPAGDSLGELARVKARWRRALRHREEETLRRTLQQEEGG